MSLVCDCSAEAEAECKPSLAPANCRAKAFCKHDWRRRDRELLRPERTLYVCHLCGCGVWIGEGDALP